jgi:hypothetical protein
MFQKKEAKAQVYLDENVEYRHLDKDGNIKPIFQENRFAIWLMKKGWLSPLWINGFLRNISFLFGYWSESKIIANLITTTGKAAAASRINGSGAEALFDKIGVGTGTTAANVADTTLETEKASDGTAASGVHVISAATATRVTTTVTNDTAQLVGTVNFTATLAVTESGLFNAATNGVLLARQVFSAVNVITGDSIQLTWKIKAA